MKMDTINGRAGIALAIMSLWLLPVTVGASEPLVTDRPDFTESSSSVGRGVLQLESGTTFATFSGGADVATLGEILLRWGVLEKLELRFLLPTYAWERGESPDRSGFIDTAVGLKYELSQGGGSGFIGGMEAAILASTTLPTAGGDFETGEFMPAVTAAISWELSQTVGFGMNLGIGWPSDGDDRFTSAWLSAALGVGLSDTTSIFFELFGFDREEARGPSTLNFQTGVTYLISSDLQLDMRAARRLSDAGPDILLGIGASWRWGSRR